MRNSKELELLGEQISREYVEAGVDLTESLKKQANANNLNQQQIKRIAESANVETYLNLAQHAEDGYVEFPLADAKQVFEDISSIQKKEASHMNHSNQWKNLPSPNTKKAEEIFNLEKIATDNSVISFNEISDELLDIKRLENKVDFNYFSLLDKYAKAEHEVKQATAQGQNIADIKEVIKVAAPDNNELLVKDLTSNLAAGMPTQDFNKVAEAAEDYVVNKKTEVYKAAELYEETANTLHDDVITLLNKKLEFANKVKDGNYRHYIKEATAKMPFLKSLSKLNPLKTKTRVAVTTAVVVAPIGVSAGKKEEQYKQMHRNIAMGKVNG